MKHKDMRQAELGSSRAEWDGSRLCICTGEIMRAWTLTPQGLQTCEFGSMSGERLLPELESTMPACDWHIRSVTDREDPELVDVRLRQVADSFFTSDHIEVIAEFAYSGVGLGLRYVVWVYPGAFGIRTQLHVKALRQLGKDNIAGYLGGSYAEKLNIRPAAYRRSAAGYYNDTQHRNRDECPIMREETHSGPIRHSGQEIYDWANLLALEKDDYGILLVKESHKCVNQRGIDTGEFVLDANHVRVTGIGLTPENYAETAPWMRTDRWRECWATWSILYDGSDVGRQLAAKQFERLRFKPHFDLDLRSRANTWGSRMGGNDSRAAAEEKNVLREIQSCADLGIDALAIDDGWQCELHGNANIGEYDWRPNKQRFPGGWKKVRQAAEKAGVALDLWIPWSATAEQMIHNYDEGHFHSYKIDFMNLNTRTAIETLQSKITQLVEHSGYQVRISWDATENVPRLGYYFGREFGSIYPANRKPSPDQPRTTHVVYAPRLVFRDAWHLAHYINLNQIEITIQNIDRVKPDDSNAGEYSHAYCTALAMMGLPLFFQEVQLYTESARKEIRPLLSLYRQHRREIASGFVFPIGDEPCDAAWSGFQSHQLETETGYLTVFREIHAEEKIYTIRLCMLDNRRLEIEDLLSNRSWQQTLDGNGKLRLKIDRPGKFLFLRYKITK